ncbi:MAG: DUF1003 domain-containing protein [Ktedonobacteraceae bacterium]|nr:DUF1003 domain-containing protein [Ktedonobacteraceae bacterium]
MYKHHYAIINVNDAHNEKLTVGQKVADAIATGMGSWSFIIIQSLILAAWIILNLVAWVNHWDPYPFIFLNLTLSFQAAYAAPFILMSQNRQSTKDRLAAENDYKTNIKSEQEVTHVIAHLDHQDELTREILLRLEAQNKRIQDQENLIIEIVQAIREQNNRSANQHQEILQHIEELKK